MKNFWLLLCVITLSAPCFANSDGDKIPNNQIWYTTTDGNVMTFELNDFETFGANINSNTYENGKGIITFDSNVTKIGSGAFSHCKSLTSITIPNSVATIRTDAFSGSSNLKSITIPNSAPKIEPGAFTGCTSLKFNGKFAADNGRCLIVDGKLVAFLPAELTQYAIPNSVTEIGEGAFAICVHLTNITIPNSVTKIGIGAFSKCRSLTNITIPNSVTTIGEGAFFGCTSLKEFSGKFAADNGRCLIIDGKLVSFTRTELSHYTIPSSVTKIGIGAFSHCISLASVTIPDSVTTIEEGVFYKCVSLTSITIPNNVTEIGVRVFFDCPSLNSVYCKAITPPNLGVDALYYLNNYREEKIDCTIYVPRESVDAYKNAEGWNEYADQIVGYDF